MLFEYREQCDKKGTRNVLLMQNSEAEHKDCTCTFGYKSLHNSFQGTTPKYFLTIKHIHALFSLFKIFYSIFHFFPKGYNPLITEDGEGMGL